MKTSKKVYGAMFCTKFRNALLIAGSFLAISCSEKNDDLEKDIEPQESIVEKEEPSEVKIEGNNRLYGFWCGSKVQFRDLKIETTWLSKKASKTQSFNACGVDNEGFLDKYSSGNVVFRARKGRLQRTELKEAPGKEKGLWFYKQFTFNAYYKNLVPGKGFTIAQVHNRGNGVKRPLLRVYIENNRVKIKVTTNNPKNSTGKYKVYNGPRYIAGTNARVTVTLNKGKATIWVKTTSGSLWKQITPTSSWNSVKNSYYLKAGLYNQDSNAAPYAVYSDFMFHRQ